MSGSTVSPPFLLNENYYIDYNPDVALVAADGMFTDGFQHFELCGQFEERALDTFFDPTQCLADWSDIAAAVNASDGTFSAYDHFIRYGINEDRSNGSFASRFNNTLYVIDNPDVAAAIHVGRFINNYEHHLEYGEAEGRTAFNMAGMQINGSVLVTPAFTPTPGLDTLAPRGKSQANQRGRCAVLIRLGLTAKRAATHIALPLAA